MKEKINALLNKFDEKNFKTAQVFINTISDMGLKEEIQLDKCVNKAHELGMKTLYIDRAFIHNRAWTKAGLEKARRRLKLIKEQSWVIFIINR